MTDEVLTIKEVVALPKIAEKTLYTDRMKDPVVLAKARAAAIWCKHSTARELATHGKPWRYVLIPHDAIADNMTVGGVAKRYTFAALEEGR